MNKNTFLIMLMAALFSTQLFAQRGGSMSSGGSQFPFLIIKGKAAAKIAEASEFDNVNIGDFIYCDLDTNNDVYCKIDTMDADLDSKDQSVTIYGYAAYDLSKTPLNANGDKEIYESTGVSCGIAMAASDTKVFCKLKGYVTKVTGVNINE